jgi:hypothetical protein
MNQENKQGSGLELLYQDIKITQELLNEFPTTVELLDFFKPDNLRLEYHIEYLLNHVLVKGIIDKYAPRLLTDNSTSIYTVNIAQHISSLDDDIEKMKLVEILLKFILIIRNPGINIRGKTITAISYWIKKGNKKLYAELICMSEFHGSFTIFSQSYHPYAEIPAGTIILG